MHVIHIIAYILSIGIAAALAVWSLIIICDAIMQPVDLNDCTKESVKWFSTTFGKAALFILIALMESVPLFIFEVIILAITRIKKPITTALIITYSFLSVVIVVIMITSIVFLIVKPSFNCLDSVDCGGIFIA